MFIEKLENELNVNTTENGAKGFRTTKKALLDLNFAVSSLRSANETTIVRMFRDAWFEDKELALKWLFFARDVRGGLGERRLFRVVIADIVDELNAEVIGWIITYGRYDDLFVLLGTHLEDYVLSLIKTTLINDMQNMKNKKPVSLLAKWMPSENTSSKESVKLARFIMKKFLWNAKDYRKTLSALRKYIDVTEVKMSAKKWDDIDYEKVPSRANLIYNGAFLRNDENRRREFLSALEKGDAKINAGVLYPHDIVHSYLKNGYSTSSVDLGLEGMWNALPNYVEGNANTIVVADGSGSMTSRIGNTDIMALTVANALAIYFAERLTGEFKDKYITFSERPQLVDFKGRKTLRDKIDKALQHSEIANTNIRAVFKLILSTAIKNNMSQDEIPQNILILSDMEFDSATSGRIDKKLFETIAREYEEAGYTLPRLAFWNLQSRTGTIPMIQNKLGVVLVSGFSPSIAKMVLSNKTDPYEALLEVLNGERYERVKLSE